MLAGLVGVGLFHLFVPEAPADPEQILDGSSRLCVWDLLPRENPASPRRVDLKPVSLQGAHAVGLLAVLREPFPKRQCAAIQHQDGLLSQKQHCQELNVLPVVGEPATSAGVPKKKADGPAPPPELLGLPSRLVYARERSGMTQAAVARGASMDPGQLSRLEKGERGPGIEAATVIRLAHALGVPVGWLAADEGTLPPAPLFTEPSDRRRKANRKKST